MQIIHHHIVQMYQNEHYNYILNMPKWYKLLTMNPNTLLAELIHTAFIQKLRTQHESYSKTRSSNKSQVYSVLHLDLIILLALTASTLPTAVCKPCKNICKARLPPSRLMAKLWSMSTVGVANLAPTCVFWDLTYLWTLLFKRATSLHEFEIS